MKEKSGLNERMEEVKAKTSCKKMQKNNRKIKTAYEIVKSTQENIK